MNKGIIIGGALAAVAVLSCAVGGAVLATKMESNNNTPVQSKVKVTAEEVKEGWKKENDSWHFYKNNNLQVDWIKDKNSWYYLAMMEK
jgi:glucan-binding YG repeat protein